MSRHIRPLILGAITSMLACTGADNPAEPGPIPGQCRDARDFSTCLPGWGTFAPLQAEVEPAPQGQAAVRQATEPLERIDSLGNTVSLGNVTFVCTDQTYSFVDNPERAISFNIDETKIWPGALIQGKGHRDGTSIGSVEALPIEERAPLSVTMSFNNQDNTRLVDNPSYGTVSAAVGSMIGNAQAQGLATANNIDFFAETYSGEKQAALSFGVSGRYLAFEAKASGSLTRTSTTNTVAAKFIQQMYVAGVTQPATPQAFFSSAFGPEKYQEHVALQQIGPDNPPLYVSRIGYGRMMVFAMTATAEASDMKAALDLAWRGVGAGGSSSLNARQRSILSQSQIRITQVGGDQSNALAAIRSGNLADYFTNEAPLTSAAPLWFELKTLSGQVAQVSEPGTYTETTCIPRLPGTFDYQDEVSLAIPFTTGTQRQVANADVNGDGRMDIVFNERRSGTGANSLNIVHVALAQASGSYTLAAPDTSTQPAADGWENYRMLAADVDGDGRDDLVWNFRDSTNVVYTAMSEGSGSFAWRARQVHTNRGWSNFTVSTGDLNGDGKTDLLFTSRTPTVMRFYFGFARADSTFSMIANFRDIGGNYTGYITPRIARLDGNATGDIVLNNRTADAAYTYSFRVTPIAGDSATLTQSLSTWTGSGWLSYQFHLANIDGANGTDLMWVRTTGVPRIWAAVNNGGGSFTAQSTGMDPPFAAGPAVHLADFNNDGRTDVLLNRRVTAGADNFNELIVGFGGSNARFSFPAGPQRHPRSPSVGWANFDQVFVGDVNGDQRADIVWTNPSGEGLYVALAR